MNIWPLASPIESPPFPALRFVSSHHHHPPSYRSHNPNPITRTYSVLAGSFFYPTSPPHTLYTIFHIISLSRPNVTNILRAHLGGQNYPTPNNHVGSPFFFLDFKLIKTSKGRGRGGKRRIPSYNHL